MRKYYIEISEFESVEYMFQSKWFDTEQQAIEWAKSIYFLDTRYDIWLMTSIWNIEEDTYTDIESVRRIDMELKL